MQIPNSGQNFKAKKKVSQRSRILGSIQHPQEPEPLDGALVLGPELTSIAGCNFPVRGSFLMPCSSCTWMLQGQGTHHGLGKRIPLLPYHWHLTLYLPLALKSWLPGQAIRSSRERKRRESSFCQCQQYPLPHLASLRCPSTVLAAGDKVHTQLANYQSCELGRSSLLLQNIT